MVLAKKTYWRCAFRPPQTELDVGLWISRPHQCHGCHLQREGGQADEERQHWHGKGGTRGRRTERKPKRNERPLPFQSLRWTLIERHSLLFNVDAQVEILVPTHTQALPTCQRSSEYITSHRNSAPRSAVAFQHLRQLKGTTLVDKTPTLYGCHRMTQGYGMNSHPSYMRAYSPSRGLTCASLVPSFEEWRGLHRQVVTNARASMIIKIPLQRGSDER